MSTIVQTGFQLAQTVISNGAVTGNKWSNPNNLLLTDGDVAQSNPGAGVASDVAIGNFLANVPSNAIITGIEIELIGAYSGSPTSPAITISPYLLDDSSGTDIYYPYVTPQVLSITPTDYILGSSTYLFASSFTPDQINNAKIQLVSNGDVYMDAVKINIFYYIPDTILPPPPAPTSCDDCNQPIQAQAFYLAQPFLSGDRYAYFQSFNYPDGTPIQYSDLGSCGGSIKFVFDEGVPKVGTSNFEENAQSAIWTVQPNETVKFDFGDINTFRGLMFHTPYTADPTLRSNHDANSKVIISNSGPFYGQYLQRCQIGQTISAPLEVDSNTTLVAKPVVKLNFTGAGVTPTQDMTDPDQVNINIPGGAGTTPPVIVVSESATSENVQVPSLTFSIDSSGVNRAIIVQVCTEQAKTITGITYNGVALTHEVTETDAGNNLRTEQWILVSPALGTHNVVISLSAPAYISAGAEILVSVDQSTPTGSTSSSLGTSTAPSTTLVTTYANSIILSSLTTALTPILYTPGAGQVSNWFQTANGVTRQGASALEASGSAPDSVVLNYTITQNTNWCMTGLEIKGITIAPPVVASLTVEDVAAGTIVPNTTLLVFPTGSVANPLPGKAVVSLVASVTGLHTDNTDPENPIVKISVDGSTITGLGTLGSPLVAHASGSSISYANGTTTKNAADGSTTQVIPHGLLSAPNKVKITAIYVDGGAAHWPQALAAWNSSTGQSSISSMFNASGTLVATFSLNASGGAGSSQTGTISVDVTDINIAWAKTGAPVGVYFILWEAEV